MNDGMRYRWLCSHQQWGDEIAAALMFDDYSGKYEDNKARLDGLIDGKIKDESHAAGRQAYEDSLPFSCNSAIHDEESWCAGYDEAERECDPGIQAEYNAEEAHYIGKQRL